MHTYFIVAEQWHIYQNLAPATYGWNGFSHVEVAIGYVDPWGDPDGFAWESMGTSTCNNSMDVAPPAPDCPAEPIGVGIITYPVIFGTDPPGSNNIGYFSRVGSPSVSSEAYCASSEWRLKVTSAQHILRIDVDLSNMGNAQIDNHAIDTANCSTLETMKSSLETKAASITASFGGWYDEGAVKAHEHVHRERYETAVNPLFTVAKASIESISIPLSAASNQAAAYALLTGPNTPYDFILFELTSTATNAYFTSGGHGNSIDFIGPQQTAVAPFITRINGRLGSCP